jgi:CTP synthase (UTP-ammonia lyase)
MDRSPKIPEGGVDMTRIVALGDRDDRHLTHREVDAALAAFPPDVEGSWVATDSPEAHRLSGADGVWLLPGSPYRNTEVAFAAVRHCLETQTPFLGTCAGFQYACVELARSVAGMREAAHAELEPDGQDLVIKALACSLYGEIRLVQPIGGTRLASICGERPFQGFHYCGYGLDERHAEVLADHGVVLSATAPDAGVEAIEMPNHPFFIATSFQPQVGVSSSRELPPLLISFLAAARAHDSAGAGIGPRR